MNRLGVDDALLHSIFKDHFGLDPEEVGIQFELLLRAHIPERFDAIREEYLNNLKNHANKDAVERRLYVGKDFVVEVQAVYRRSEVRGIAPESELYYPVCTLEEIKRIENVSSLDDVLLKLRADAIADHPRLNRVFLARRAKRSNGWSLTKHFDDSAFHRYLERLPIERQKLCAGAICGFAFLQQPDGVCMRTSFGDLVVISEALKYFLYYMNVFMVGENFGVPETDRSHAMWIGLRTMLGTETLDFDLDHRGELPEEVDRSIAKIVEAQMRFVMGHEFAHLYLGHLSGAAVECYSHEQLGGRGRGEYYNLSQQQEFAADLAAIDEPGWNGEELGEILNGAVLFFSYIHLFDVVVDYIAPRKKLCRTHPDALDRIWHLHRNVVGAENLIPEDRLNRHIEVVQGWARLFREDALPYHLDELETYRAVYLPSYKKTLTSDRFDY